MPSVDAPRHGRRSTRWPALRRRGLRTTARVVVKKEADRASDNATRACRSVTDAVCDGRSVRAPENTSTTRMLPPFRLYTTYEALAAT